MLGLSTFLRALDDGGREFADIFPSVRSSGAIVALPPAA